MGLLSTLDKMRARAQVPKHVRAAAAQMWDAIQRGKTFEVPFAMDANDPTMLAVWLLFKEHPELPQIVRQSRSFILTQPERINVSEGVQEIMRRGGQFAKANTFAADIQRMIQGQVDFLDTQGLDAAQMSREAKEAEAKKHAITVEGDKPAEPAPTVTPEPPAAA